MILGIGVDMASVQFWADALTDPTTSVIEGTFTERERSDAHAGPVPTAERLAARFAAKEAFTKAISGGRHGQPPEFDRIDPLDVEVERDKWGRPQLKLTGRAAILAERFGVSRTWVSLSHEASHAVAMVVLEGD